MQQTNNWDQTVHRALTMVAKAARQEPKHRLERAMRVAKGMLCQRPRNGYNRSQLKKIGGRQSGRKRARQRIR